MKKSDGNYLQFLAVIISIIVSLTLIGAANETTGTATNLGDETTKVDKAYTCLENQVKEKDSLSLQQAIFAGLALGFKGNISKVISTQEKTEEHCWPKSSCTLKETAQIALLYQRTGKNDDDLMKWLSTRNGTSTELTWFLEIDIPSKSASACTITFDGQKRDVKIRSDMTVGDNAAGSCFTIAASKYWLQVKPACLDKNFEISCDQDFVTSLLYTKGTGETLFVVSDSHSSTSLGSTSEKIKAKCFKSGSRCDYEGSLWAASALYRGGEDIAPYIPYLIALSDDQPRFFPSTFMYMFLGGDDYYSKLVQQQKQAGYWEIIGSPYNRYYDTSLAMLALGSSSRSSPEIDLPKSYLLGTQTKDGCWNQRDAIIDTGFILYAGWPRGVAGESGTTPSTPQCLEVSGQPYSCEIGNVCTEAGGQILSNFECRSLGVCCSIKVPEKTCTQKQGQVCTGNKQCTGTQEQSADGQCCVGGSCQEPSTPLGATCENAGGTCADECNPDTEDTLSEETCDDANQYCCTAKTTPPPTTKWWIWILVALIILVLLAIVFRKQIQIWWFNQKKKKGARGNKDGENVSGPRPFPPRSFGGPAMPPRMMMGGRPPMRPVMPPRQLSRVPNEKDKEIEETLKKIKDMAK